MFKRLAVLTLTLLLLVSCAEEAALPTRPVDTAASTASDMPPVEEATPNKTDTGRHLSITAGFSQDYNEILNRYADAFIERHPDVTIQINPTKDDPTAYATAIATELLGGGGDDLILAKSFPYVTYARMGLFVDLYEYMSEEMRADFYPKVLEARTVDGGLYALPNGFVVPAYYLTDPARIALANTLLGEKTTLSYREAIDVFQAAREKFPEILYPGGFFSADVFLAGSELPRFYNCDTGYVNFEEEFISAVKEIEPFSINPNTPPPTREYFFEMFLGFSTFYTATIFLPTSPDRRGWLVVGCDGTPMMWEKASTYAINANSKNKDLAWEFLKFMSSEEGVVAALDTSALPVRKSVLYGAVLRDAVAFGLSRESAEVLVDYFDVLLAEDFVGFTDGDILRVNTMQSAFDDYYLGLLTAEQLAARLQEKLTLYVNQ